MYEISIEQEKKNFTAPSSILSSCQATQDDNLEHETVSSKDVFSTLCLSATIQ